MTVDKTDRGAYVALGAIFGIAAGIGAGMLLAPRSGAETRGRLRTRGQAMKEQAAERLAERHDAMKHTLSKSLDTSKNLIDTANRKTKEVVDKAASHAKDMADDVKSDTDKPDVPQLPAY